LPLPGKTLFYLLWLLLATAIIARSAPPLLVAWKAVAIAALALAILDGVRLSRREVPRIRRLAPDSLALGQWHEIGLRLTNDGRHTLQVEVFDHYPAEAKLWGLPRTVQLTGNGGWAEVVYRIAATERGDVRFTGVQMRIQSPWRLWRRDRMLDLAHDARVYPNFAAVAHYRLLATDNRVGQMGIRHYRRRGQGLEFHQLREYREGDALRQIDWKTTARLRRLTAREYQDERNQEVIFLIDCGHRMRARDQELSHFDHALNAMLLLTYVALRQGDAVGIGTFGGTARWLKPAKGQNTASRILDTLYDLQPTTGAPDYEEAAVALVERQKKRALVIVVTNLREEDNSELLPAVQLLRRHHLVLVASLREEVLTTMIEQPVLEFRDALLNASAHHYLQTRYQGLDRLRASGVECVDVAPSGLSVALINSYLAIKASGRL
jgi:uncharacterized protein (DUF58 family)